ncbi:MAG TPA: Ig-like domain-containing protein [Candidatus Binatia bacterium]|nr:Ig-like domain-containing protein [Candidatus Binatia bacterium]
MRRLAAAALAVPVLIAVYTTTLLRRSIAARLGLALGGGALLGLGIIAALSSTPADVTARPETTPTPLPAAAFTTRVQLGMATDAALTVAFSRPMDPASVAAALEVTPPARLSLAWNASFTELTVRPAAAWAPATYYTLTVGTGARDRAGNPLAEPVRQAFVVRPSTVGRIVASGTVGERIRLDSAITFAFDRPIDLGSLAAALRIEPSVEGRFVLPDGRELDAGDLVEGVRGRSADRLVFRPAGLLAPDTTYRFAVEGTVRDVEGALVGTVAPLEVRTVAAPRVVRFRPRNGTTGVDRGANVSVRFSQAMDRATTTPAFTVTVDGRPVDGTRRWAEGDTVLVVDLAADLPYGAKVVLAVDGRARSAVGAPLAEPARATFTVEPKPAPPPPRRTSTGTSSSGSTSGSGSSGSATWYAVETYYFRLLNCTRTGGLVSSSGSCSGAGSGPLAAFLLDAGISSKVARPYAKLLATKGICSHFADGDPGDRLRRAGYPNYVWGENIGCRSGDPYAAVLGSHLYFQAERSTNGGHWRNIMNPAYDRVGIGVWVSSGRVRLVVDFYHP